MLLALMTLTLTGSAVTGHGRRVAVEYACPPFEESPAWVRAPDRSEDCGFTATGTLIALIVGILGFALGRATAPPPYDRARLRGEVDRLTGIARADARARNENFADLALQDLGDAFKRAI
jgi:hypothetical protein